MRQTATTENTTVNTRRPYRWRVHKHARRDWTWIVYRVDGEVDERSGKADSRRRAEAVAKRVCESVNDHVEQQAWQDAEGEAVAGRDAQ